MFFFALPKSGAAWGALLLALLLIAAWRLPERKSLSRSVWSMPSLAAAAALLSIAYFHFYLGGGPRVIDATAYLLEARSFAEGSFSFAAPTPVASSSGRFLVSTASDSTRLAPIFPPGYPALLSLAVHLGSYKLLGPLLAAALVALTYQLTWRLTHRRTDALVAAFLSVISANLRYHTAETMSHGLAAVLTALTIWATIEWRTPSATRLQKRWPVLFGACLGALLATRQLTGALVLLACACNLLPACLTRKNSASNTSHSSHAGARAQLLPLGLAALSLIPGLLLLLAHQHAVSGDVFTSAQTRYYSLADGPTGCFGLGFGKGCHYEHADVVATQGGQGLTWIWALKNTLHRLHWHSLDVSNFEPLILIGLFFAYRARKKPAFLPLLLPLLFLPLGYSLFYFNGSYPGGGARFFSELIPLWHVLIAAGLCTLRIVPLGLISSLLGFAFHASLSHDILQSPHFGPQTAKVEGLENEVPASGSPAIVFFSSAHLYNVAKLSSPRFTALRHTRDAREDFLVNELSPSTAWSLEKIGKNHQLVPWRSPPKSALPGSLVLEAEADYPPRAQAGLWVHPEHVGAACVSKGRALRLHLNQGDARLSLETLPGSHHVQAIVVDRGGKCHTLELGESLSGSIAFQPHRFQWQKRQFTHLDRLMLRPIN